MATVKTSAFDTLPVITFENTTFETQRTQVIVCADREVAKREWDRLHRLKHIANIVAHDATVKFD